MENGINSHEIPSELPAVVSATQAEHGELYLLNTQAQSLFSKLGELEFQRGVIVNQIDGIKNQIAQTISNRNQRTVEIARAHGADIESTSGPNRWAIDFTGPVLSFRRVTA